MRDGFPQARLACLLLSLVLQARCWSQDTIPAKPTEPFATWINTAPPGIKRLIDIGQVTFEIDDQELIQRKKQGLTRFRFDYRYRYRFSNSITKPQSSDDGPRITVAASIFVSDIQCSHRVVVGSTFKPESPWKSKLLQHEFDHVSISTDPRLKVLLKLALGADMQFEILAQEIQSQENQTLAQHIENQIATRMKHRVSEIERVTQAFNDRFDKESRNGSESIRQREELFVDFFAPESLQKLDFQSSEILSQYAKAIAKSTWKEHYLLNAPD
jgi:hypothetical protein